ncbi:EcsC family protein [Bacillus sp. Xin]|uniref:EcsC family protein n=1 Tax=unclassified Bacillus (in: firmicutes) TaxID=185979 RepID=UPI001574E0AD|nr:MULTISPECIES: EcsC family protein [unclassified Bacillus (in: firmicutes)]MBC6971643.1 EcsC family protein [Bacillus sp. Xin]NSW39047.1 EcsC family protein [Bacillus sp. Xin1]
MESKELLLKEITMIEKWEKEQEDLWFFEKWGKIPFAILDKLTPKFIHKKINLLLDELIQYLNSGSKYLIHPQTTIEKFENAASLTDVQKFPLSEMDSIVDKMIKNRKSVATAQGATTGFGGIFTLAIDIPAILSMSLNVLQEIAICYGYNPEDMQERLFIVKCLQFSSSDMVGKQTILHELKHFDSRANHDDSMSQVKSWREVFTVYRDNYGWKKLFQIIPVAGMIFGAYLNRKTIEEIAEVGKMLYKKRRVLDRLKEMEYNSN